MNQLEREDEELGTVRLCTRCNEEWPKDREFFYFDHRRQDRVVGPCIACWSEWNKERHLRSKVA